MSKNVTIGIEVKNRWDFYTPSFQGQLRQSENKLHRNGERTAADVHKYHKLEIIKLNKTSAKKLIRDGNGWKLNAAYEMCGDVIVCLQNERVWKHYERGRVAN